MKVILDIFVLVLIQIVNARINIDVRVQYDKSLSVKYQGIEVSTITDEDVGLFNIDEANLKAALKQHFGRHPSRYYLKSPTPWGDLYKKYKWEQITRVLSIKSVNLLGITKNPVVVMSQDFENESNTTITVNTGISHTVENTLTTSWTEENAITVSQEVEYDVNVIFAKVSGTTAFSYTSTWGVSEEKTQTETIGVTSAVEMELKPGQAVRAVLSANAGYLEIEVIHRVYLRGNVAVNFKKAHEGHHFWGPSIGDVMKSGGLVNEVIAREKIKFGYHVDASLKVYDKLTGLPR